MKSTYPGPGAALARYHAAVDATPGADCKGAAMPYTSRNGHMYSFLDPSGTMALRLPPAKYAEYLGKYADAGPAVQHGRPLKNFVTVPDALMENVAELRTWLVISHEWVGTLKPKPTARK